LESVGEIAGICPGPTLASIGSGNSGAMVFLVAMLAGMGINQAAQNRGGLTKNK